MGSEDVLLEHEFFGILLTFAEDTLIGAAIGPVVLADPDGVGGRYRRDARDLDLGSRFCEVGGLGGRNNISIGGILVGRADELMIVVFYGDTVYVKHMRLDDIRAVLDLVSTKMTFVLAGVVLKRILGISDLVLLKKMIIELTGVSVN